jgi:hypothetical protein
MDKLNNVNELAPCPFCGAGQTQLIENGRVWSGMKYGPPVSVSVRHWCEIIEGQPSRMIERVGRDLESAVRAWNMRAHQKPVALSEASIYDACLSYRHDFGLMSTTERLGLFQQAREWARAFGFLVEEKSAPGGRP